VEAVWLLGVGRAVLRGSVAAAIAGKYTLIVLAALVFLAPLLILGRMWRQTH